MIIICDLLSRTSLFCWRNFSHQERRMGDCEALRAVWSSESSVVDCLGNEEAVVHEQSFFCACGNLARAAGEFYAEISIRTCVAVEDLLLFYLYWPRILLILCPAHPERGNQGRFFSRCYYLTTWFAVQSVKRPGAKRREKNLIFCGNFRHVKCHLWHSGD